MKGANGSSGRPWLPAGLTASLYGAGAALALAGLLVAIAPEQHWTLSGVSVSGGQQFSPDPSVVTRQSVIEENKNLIDAVEFLRQQFPEGDTATFVKTLIDNTSSLPDSDRDAIINKTLLTVLMDLEAFDPETRSAMAEAVSALSQPDYRALGFSKLAERTNDGKLSEQYAKKAWAAIAESRQAPAWYSTVAATSWPIFALVLGFVATNACSAFLSIVGERVAEHWLNKSGSQTAQNTEPPRQPEVENEEGTT